MAGGTLRVETTRASTQSNRRRRRTATSVRARPRAQKRDFERRFPPPRRTATIGLSFTPAQMTSGRHVRTSLRPGTAAFRPPGDGVARFF